MNLKKISTLCFITSTSFTASSVMAWESADGIWTTSARVALSSDYVWRGISQTDSEPAISGSFDVGHSSGAYAGVWASNVDIDDDTSIEIDYYAGFIGEFGESGVFYDVGGTYYNYPDQSDLDFFEFYGSVGYSFLTAGLSYTQDLFGTEAQDDLYYSLDAAYDVGSISLAAGVGYYDFDSGDDYTNYHIGASTELAGFGFDLTYSDTDNNAEDIFGGDLADSALIFTVSKSM